MSDERFDRIEQRLDALESGQGALRAEIGRRFDDVDRRFDDQNGHMRVLYEDVIARIAAIVAPSALIAAVERRIGELGDRIDRRLDPIEAAICQHSVDIAALKKARR